MTPASRRATSAPWRCVLPRLPAVTGSDDVVARLAELAESAGIRRIHVLAWRDLDDPEAGGSELHAHEVLRMWTRAGIDINMRTSFSPGQRQVLWRDGYRVIRKAGRYMVFPRAAFSELAGWHGGRDALVEIWNGMPFWSPVWCRGPRVAWMHHLHDTMWEMSLPPKLARVGRAIEFDLAPPLYRLTRTPIVTLSNSSKHELVSRLHFPDKQVSVVPVGVGEQYSPGGAKAAVPTVVACGRLVPVKRFPMLIESLVAARTRVPNLEAWIIGEGYERPELEAMIAAANASDWLRLTGFVSDEEKVALYRSAWVLASASAHEGWGMTLTEAAACGTPSIATDISGHRDALAADHSGLLVDSTAEMTDAIVRVLTDTALRDRLTNGALEHAQRFTWGATALGTLEILCAQAARSRRT